MKQISLTLTSGPPDSQHLFTLGSSNRVVQLAYGAKIVTFEGQWLTKNLEYSAMPHRVFQLLTQPTFAADFSPRSTAIPLLMAR